MSLIEVKTNNYEAILTMQNIVRTKAFIGINGRGKQKEGDGKTPLGLYDLGIAFGIKENPRNQSTIC